MRLRNVGQGHALIMIRRNNGANLHVNTSLRGNGYDIHRQLAPRLHGGNQIDGSCEDIREFWHQNRAVLDIEKFVTARPHETRITGLSVERDTATTFAMGVNERIYANIEPFIGERRGHNALLPRIIGIEGHVLGHTTATKTEMRAERLSAFR